MADSGGSDHARDNPEPRPDDPPPDFQIERFERQGITSEFSKQLRARRSCAKFLRQAELHFLNCTFKSGNWARATGLDGDERSLTGAADDQPQAKRSWITNTRTDHDERSLWGLAISGGGLRSATFGLGMMQSLARHGILAKIDYLSTVSGGGYIGSALTWLLQHNAGLGYGVEPGNFPFGTQRLGVSVSDAPRDRSRNRQEESTQDAGQDRGGIINYLRQHGRYLAPHDIGVPAFVGVILRSMLLSFLSYVPLVVGAVFVLHWLGLFDPNRLVGVFDLVRDGWSGVVAATHLRLGEATLTINGFGVLAVLLLSILILLFVAYGVATRLATVRYKTLQEQRQGYSLRRWFEGIGGSVLQAAAACCVLGSVPGVYALLGGLEGQVAGLFAGSGIAAQVWAFARSAREMGGRRLDSGAIATVGSALLIYGLLLLGYSWAEQLRGASLEAQMWVWSTIGALVLLGFLVNANHVSIHRYYRDRLMETYMPDLNADGEPQPPPAHGANRSPLHEMCRRTGPFHLINTNVVLVDSEQPRLRGRGGMSFVLSPLYFGGDATGWRAAAEYEDYGLDLATAMAISGAAVNPSTGVGGRGVTRNRLLSAVMSLLNLSLVYWAPNPRRPGAVRRTPNHYIPGLSEFPIPVVQRGLNEKRSFLRLTDGGHFENLGVYELVRRGCRLIIVSDAGQDADFAFADLGTAIERVRVDFGVRIEFEQSELQQLVVTRDEEREVETFANRGYAVGRIRYTHRLETDATHDNQANRRELEGTIILIKTTLTDRAAVDVMAYHRSHIEFPDQSTSDQFFSERQFEAYRELGFQLTDDMVTSEGFERWLKRGADPDERYVWGHRCADPDMPAHGQRSEPSGSDPI